jgi:hypothetical protein
MRLKNIPNDAKRRRNPYRLKDFSSLTYGDYGDYVTAARHAIPGCPTWDPQHTRGFWFLRACWGGLSFQR